MSIGKRFWNMARSELNSLLDKAAQIGDGDESPPVADDGLDSFSERELEAELERRRRERQARPQPRPTPSAGAGAGQQTRRPAERVFAGDAVRKAYAALEVPNGADLDTVKKSYRRLMRKYHPDRHVGAADKQKAAHDLSLRLTQAYETLKKHLAPR